jgi:hypothetical protein
MLTLLDSASLLTTSHVLQVGFPALGESLASQETDDRLVHVIPQNAEPRWIILGAPWKALPVLRSWRPWNLKSRLQWSAVLFAASTRVLPHLAGVVNSHDRIDSSYWRQHLPEFSDDWNAVIHVGSRSYTRKAIVFFFGKDLLVNAVAKVPLTQAAALAILNEAAILDRMRAVGYLPRIIFRDPVRGVAAQSWLVGKPVSRGFTAAHLDLLSLLANPGRTTRVSDYAPGVAAQLDKADLPFDRSVLLNALELLNFDEPLQGFVEHRDFAPWNLKWISGGRLGLLDWEWAVTDSLPWQDICRFFYLEDAHFNGSGRVWETMGSNRLLQIYRKRFAIPTHALTALTMHYLLRVLCMDWQSRNVHLTQYTFKQIQLLLNTCRRIAT